MMTAKPMPENVTFAELIAGIYFIRQAPEVKIDGLCIDSRQAQKGDLFFALGGAQVHGKEFIDEAIKRGASVVLWESSTPREEKRNGGNGEVPVYGVPDLRNMLGRIAERFYGEPTKEQFVIGVTGTNGKTSVTQFIAHALQQDAPCGVIGTLGNGVFGQLEKGGYTTPDAITLHTLLDDLRHENVRNVVMEASSHGLEQGRVAGVSFDVAVFTNLSHEHLDYHGSMQNYGRAKRRLFESKGLKYAVINIDDDYGRQLLVSMPGAVGTVSYGFANGGSDVLPSLLGSNLQLDRDGLRMQVESDWGKGDLQVPLLGAFNASNLLAALGALLASGIAFDDALKRLSSVTPVPGRMQGYGGVNQQPLVVVDYAHTPDALEQVLIALRAHAAAQTGAVVAPNLWCVFGCGGDRDRSKRPLMAAAAEQLADKVIVTNDNPRTENAQVIVADILQGFKRVDDVVVIEARAKAIEEAILSAAEDDVVLIAGKGHEDVQIVGDERLPFSDAEEVERVLALRASGGGSSK